MILVYTMWYGAERFVVESLRTDSLMIGNLRVSQVVAILSAIAALIIMLVVLQKKKASNDPEYLKLYVDTEEAQLIREGKFYGMDQKKAEKDSDQAKKAPAGEAEEPVDNGTLSGEQDPPDEQKPSGEEKMDENEPEEEADQKKADEKINQ